MCENNIASVRKFIGRNVEVFIDRPKGSHHPEYNDMVYEVNYGYLPGTTGGDGEEIDIYILDEDMPVKTCKAKVIAVIMRSDDNEFKLVGVTKDSYYSDSEIKQKTDFVEKYFKSTILR